MRIELHHNIIEFKNSNNRYAVIASCIENDRELIAYKEGSTIGGHIHTEIEEDGITIFKGTYSECLKKLQEDGYEDDNSARAGQGAFITPNDTQSLNDVQS